MDTQASIQLEESTSIVCVTTSTYKRHPGEVSINEDEVILLYIEAFLISHLGERSERGHGPRKLSVSRAF